MSNNPKEEWCHEFFDDTFATVLLDRPDDNEREQTLAFLEKALDIKTEDHIFDQCCGTGAVSHILGDAGYHAHGVDIIPSYIEKAQDYSVQNCNFVCADARSYQPEGIYDAAINWYTSFGYSCDDQDNVRMLERLFDVVKIGGRIALDITNMSASFRNADKVKSYEQNTPQGIIKIERRFHFDIAKGMRGSIWRYILPDGTTQEKEGVSRLYAPRELEALLNQVGFNVLTFYGDLNGNELKMDSERCICIAQKSDNQKG